ncbi:uncharacterized protein LOC143037184 [Oratosquilla oratoria]|uniref:uncharacterized protein LOC143037184 n=1 Tax=Oratosquilla oratoria TaxID=337810 RepID=UPI003F76A9A4
MTASGERREPSTEGPGNTGKCGTVCVQAGKLSTSRTAGHKQDSRLQTVQQVTTRTPTGRQQVGTPKVRGLAACGWLNRPADCIAGQQATSRATASRQAGQQAGSRTLVNEKNSWLDASRPSMRPRNDPEQAKSISRSGD